MECANDLMLHVPVGKTNRTSDFSFFFLWSGRWAVRRGGGGGVLHFKRDIVVFFFFFAISDCTPFPRQSVTH